MIDADEIYLMLEIKKRGYSDLDSFLSDHWNEFSETEKKLLPELAPKK